MSQAFVKENEEQWFAGVATWHADRLDRWGQIQQLFVS